MSAIRNVLMQPSRASLARQSQRAFSNSGFLTARHFMSCAPKCNDKDALTPTSSETRVTQVDHISGAPEELNERMVRIFRPAKTATQSGKQGTRHWRIDFDIMDEGDRWENPLIGWASSADYVQAVGLRFATKEDAIRFAEKQGWNYYVQEPKPVRFVKKTYADNFKHCPGKLRLIRTK